MKQFIGAGLFIVIAASSAAAQESKLYSNPTLPSREVLDRLNMRMAWRVNVPMDGRRDGFVNIVSHAGQIIASTRNGVVAAYDSETGREMWKILVGKPDDATYKPTFNSKSVLVVRGVHLYAIDRLNGRLQWQYRLPFGVASAPVADERQIYLSGTNSQVAAYDLPSPGAIGAGSGSMPNANLHTDDPIEERYQKERDNLALREVHPEVMWRFGANHRLDFTPTMTRDSLFYATPGGHLFLLGKYPLTEEVREIYSFQLDNRLTIAPGIYDEMAYIATPDTNMYAISIPGGKTRWRYSAGSPVTRTPFTTDVDVYVTVERKGLVRLDRDTGDTKWKLPFGRTTTEAAPDVDRVLAVNPKFVYATDTGGRLLVLSRETGKQLSYYTPFREYNFPVPNESTDRLMLAANNGLIICLHDREYEKPLQYRKFDYDIQPATNSLKALKEKLARKISTPNVDALPLAEILENFRRRHGLDIFLSEKAFLDAGVGSVRDKPVLQARVENLEVGQVLKNILSQVGATYEIVGDTIQVLPVKREVAVNPNPMPMPMPMPVPMDNLNPKMRALLATKVKPPAIEDKLPLKEFLQFSGDRFDVAFDIDKAAYMAAGIDPEEILKAPIMYPKGGPKEGVPVAQVLHECFAQVKSDFEVRGDTIFLVPKK